MSVTIGTIHTIPTYLLDPRDHVMHGQNVEELDDVRVIPTLTRVPGRIRCEAWELGTVLAVRGVETACVTLPDHVHVGLIERVGAMWSPGDTAVELFRHVDDCRGDCDNDPSVGVFCACTPDVEITIPLHTSVVVHLDA